MKLMPLIAVAALALSNTSEAADKAKQIYNADVQRVRAHDLNFSWQEFRLAASQGGAKYLDWHPLRTTFMKDMQDGKTDEALKMAQQIIDANMAEPEGHLLALVVYQKLGKQEEAAFEKSVVDAHLKSITDSGDGKSSESAYFVVNTSEEYFFLQFAKGIGFPSSQALVQVNGHSYDKLTYTDRDGKTEESWFNTDTSMDALRKALK